MRAIITAVFLASFGFGSLAGAAPASATVFQAMYGSVCRTDTSFAQPTLGIRTEGAYNTSTTDTVFGICPVASFQDTGGSDWSANSVATITMDVDDNSSTTNVSAQACVLNASSGSTCGTSAASSGSPGHTTISPGLAGWTGGADTDYYFFSVVIGAGTTNRVRGAYITY